MFDGDTSNAGRRERLMRKRESREAFTDKIGGDRGGSSIAQTPSSIPNGPFAEGNSGGNCMPVRRAEMDTGRSDSRPGPGGENSSRYGELGGGGQQEGLKFETANFSQRVNVKRHMYEVDIICKLPIVDMVSNKKTRSISWVAVTREGSEETYSIQVPVAYDLDATSLTVDDFENGRCSISVPAKSQGVF